MPHLDLKNTTMSLSKQSIQVCCYYGAKTGIKMPMFIATH